MNCPQCNQPMIHVGLHWNCGAHEQPVPVSVDAAGPTSCPVATAGRFDLLPSVLAIPLQEYSQEPHPVMRLHRLCDAVEVLTRFATIIELGELRQRLGSQPFPEDLARALRDQIERPTLGQWKNLLRATAEGLARTDPLVVPELRQFVLRDLVTGLERGPGAQEEPGLIELRNTLVHGGAMTKAEAGRQLDVWGPWLNGVVERLDLLTDAELCQVASGAARRLVGTNAGLGAEQRLSADL